MLMTYPVICVLRTIRGLSTRTTLEEFPSGISVKPLAPVAPSFDFRTLNNKVRTAVSTQPSAVSALKAQVYSYSSFSIILFFLPEQTAIIKIGISGGSSQESENEKGSAHLLACGAFDGNAHKNGVAVMRAFEDIGAKVGAQASREDIVYTIAVGSENVAEALELAIDNVKAPIARDYMIEHARYRAAVKYARFMADPSERVSELVHEASFGENTPLGGSVYAPSLNGLLATDVLHFRNTQFSANNLLIAVHGACSASAVVDQIQAQTANGLAVGDAASFGAGFIGGEMRVRESIGGATKASLAFSAPAGNSGKAYEVLRSIVNSRVASPAQSHLHSKVHHYQSNAEWTDTFFNAYQATGLFGVNFTGDAKYVRTGLESFVNVLKAVAGGCTAEDLALAKNRLSVQSKLGAEGSLGASRLYTTLANGNGFTSAFSESDYSAVTKEEVVAAAQAALKSTPGYAVFGTTYQVPYLSDITKMMA